MPQAWVELWLAVWLAALAPTDGSKSVSAVSFGDRDLNANLVGGDVSWTPPEIDAGFETYETCLATDAAGSGEALTGSIAAGTNVCAVPPDTGSICSSACLTLWGSLCPRWPSRQRQRLWR